MKKSVYACTQIPKSQYPAVLDKIQARTVLGYTEAEFDAIIDSGHIPSLGSPRKRKHVRFATAAILELRDNLDWLSTADDIIKAHWRKGNARRKRKREALSLAKPTSKAVPIVPGEQA